MACPRPEAQRGLGRLLLLVLSRRHQGHRQKRVRPAHLQAHAALVFDGDTAIAWCQYGSPAELPGIYHRKQYDVGETKPAPWRITCFFVDRDHRRAGVAREALDGALELIARSGGGEVVSFPNELTPGKRTSSSFLHNGTRAMFEKAGFTFERHIGKSKTVMRISVPSR
jgi:GNAT superfamily N-acetyltransferase